MLKASMHPIESGRAKFSTPAIDMCAIIPILACAYASIVSPILDLGTAPRTLLSTLEPSLANRIFWPTIAAVSIICAARSYSRIGRLAFPPHIIFLFAYLAFAGASVVWAVKPELAFTRFMQQALILVTIVVPALLAGRTADLMRGLFLCFVLASILHLIFILGTSQPTVVIQNGYSGYFSTKNQLGEFAAIACLLAFHETRYPGVRRALGILAAIVAVSLLILSNSKTALGLVLLAPLLATIALIVRNKTRVSPAILLLSIPFCYLVLSSVSGFGMYRMSYWLYGDSTFTGRTTIWAFVNNQIELRPFLGWGYQSFWQTGPDGPSAKAPGWVQNMPNGHNGYYDTMLETGYVGYALLLLFIIATLHAVGRVADRDRPRARLLLSLALLIVIYNFLESFWMRGFEPLWVVFVVVAAEIGRYWQPLLNMTGARFEGPTSASRGPLRAHPPGNSKESVR
jgi:exopolysaccharide production protein ExoQ